MFSALASIHRDGQMKSESGKYAAFWWTSYEIWDRFASKGCQKTCGPSTMISNNRHGLAYIKRPDRSIIELNTILHQSRCIHEQSTCRACGRLWSMLSETCSATLDPGCHVECTMCSTLCLCFCVSVFGLLGPSVPCVWLCFCVFFGLCLAWSDCTLWWQHISLAQTALILAIFLPPSRCVDFNWFEFELYMYTILISKESFPSSLVIGGHNFANPMWIFP